MICGCFPLSLLYKKYWSTSNLPFLLEIPFHNCPKYPTTLQTLASFWGPKHPCDIQVQTYPSIGGSQLVVRGTLFPHFLISRFSSQKGGNEAQKTKPQQVFGRLLGYVFGRQLWKEKLQQKPGDHWSFHFNPWGGFNLALRIPSWILQ